MNHDSEANQTHNERRQFYRIDDHVILRYKRVEQSESELRLLDPQEKHPDSFNICAKFASISLRNAPLLRDIQDQHPAIGHYLGVLDKKLDMLAQLIFDQDADNLGEQTVSVNLSASGIALDSDEAMDNGQMLEIYLILLPSHTGIHCYTKVVHCEANNSDNQVGGHHIALQFFNITEEDSDLIAKHVFDKQSAQQRQLRENDD